MSSDLAELESKRNETYGKKLQSVSLRWESSLKLLKDGLQETARAERLILGTALVNQARADAMQAIYMDVLLDDEFNSVDDEKKQKSLLEERSKQGFAALEQANDEKKGGENSEEPKGGMLSSLIGSESTIAKKFAEDALLVASHLASEMTAFRMEQQSKVNDLSKRGDPILEDLESAEKRVGVAWDAYKAVAAKDGRGGERRMSWTTKASSTDVKQLEIDYGVAVVHQTSEWEKNSSKMADLFASVKRVESERRTKLHELLRDYVPGQQRLFSDSAAIQTQVIEELENDHSEHYPDIDHYLEDTDHAPYLGGADFEAKELPLTSNLVSAIKVVERRKGKHWQKVLAVVTEDSFLHIFEVPSSSSTPLSHPEQVFMELLPTNTPLFPSGESSQEKQNVTSESSTKEFNPLESWFLPNSSVKPCGKGGRDVEVADARVGSFLGNIATRRKKLLFRTDSQEEMEEWVNMLQMEKQSDESNVDDTREYGEAVVSFV